jgi:hypothetical protein
VPLPLVHERRRYSERFVRKPELDLAGIELPGHASLADVRTKAQVGNGAWGLLPLPKFIVAANVINRR